MTEHDYTETKTVLVPEIMIRNLELNLASLKGLDLALDRLESVSSSPIDDLRSAYLNQYQLLIEDMRAILKSSV